MPQAQVMVSKRKREAADYDQRAQPTPERLHQAGGDIEIGDDGHGHKTVTMRDSPLERALARGAITLEQYQAAEKYRDHWWRAGLCDPLQSVDFNRVSGGETHYRTAIVEAQVPHLLKTRKADEALGETGRRVVELVVCRETSLETVGRLLGWPNKAQAISAATQSLREALDALRKLWGM